MKALIIALAFVATAAAFGLEDIPEHMKDRLDRYIALKKQWEVKWSTMSVEEQNQYEQILLERLEVLPKFEHQRIRERVETMGQEQRIKLRNYLRRRFPVDQNVVAFDNEIDEIDEIVQSLPDYIRERITDAIRISFQEATAYQLNEEEVIDDELAFPDIPDIVEINGASAAYSTQLSDEILERLDEFLIKREDWKRKWERLSDEKREVFERYIKLLMN